MYIAYGTTRTRNPKLLRPKACKTVAINQSCLRRYYFTHYSSRKRGEVCATWFKRPERFAARPENFGRVFTRRNFRFLSQIRKYVCGFRWLAESAREKRDRRIDAVRFRSFFECRARKWPRHEERKSQNSGPCYVFLYVECTAVFYFSTLRSYSGKSFSLRLRFLFHKLGNFFYDNSISDS